MNDKKADFLLAASNVFMKYGIKSVTMDEMARQLGMSKKTIYTFVKDKNDLVTSCIRLGHEAEVKDICSIRDNAENAIDEFLEMSRVVSNRLKTIHPSIFFDLQKYHTKVFTEFNKSTNEFIMKSVIENLTMGKEQGLYRQNIDNEIMARMYVSHVFYLFNGEVFPANEFSYSTVHSEFFRYHIRGISSKKGLIYLQDLIKTKKYDL
ncbi:hypothetical protein DNU06_05010 [Putridiphycobacter roseus]|uniref:HTH tetR-type domain-containing protein n=1 Tax=Putridiphycobacter roseus TaxID=2219161 RepID=A0A2W1N4J6_9FLAO|nr:TetR/AcrR family transcriptional regulator [Putridiphycobacter roseus]PZE17981.1 hypothetical protein DNU06_05010 [Putridiphycobacter roseus]